MHKNRRKAEKRREAMREMTFAMTVLAIAGILIAIGFLIGVFTANYQFQEVATTSAVVEATQPETPAESTYQMAPPTFVVLSEWSNYAAPAQYRNRYRWISIDGKIAIEWVSYGGEKTGLSFIPQDVKGVAEAEDSNTPPPLTPK